jgi:ElaA protein
MHPEAQVELHTATFRDLSPTSLYALLKLRVDVFVVEQRCPYPELDGRDDEPGTRHLWLARDDEMLAYLRILADPGAERIGRVAVAAGARGRGYAARLMTAALEIVGHRPAVLDAQAHLLDFYRRYGFVPDGPGYVEDGIPHVPMRREP